jgi:steroid delta-isomerase-like uncharacterized protein
MRTAYALLAAYLVTLPACNTGGSDADVGENEVIVRTMLSIWETADTAAVLDLFWPEAVYDDFPNQTQYRGLEEIASYLTHVHGWGTGVYMNVTQVHASETGATAEWVMSAIHDKPMGSRVPEVTGREIVLNGVTIIEVERGLITRAADYIDVVPMVLQLGGSIRYPGGATLELDDIR